jgi:signal transduction histidine kinase
VTDTGSGISAEFVPHVFDLYRQADQTGDHLPGLGIGLSIVAQIVRLHGGVARVESGGPGQGSTFIVTLPLAETSEAEITATRRSGRSRRADGRRKALKETEIPC